MENMENNQKIETQKDLLIKLEKTLFKLSDKNIETSVELVMNIFDVNFPYSFNYVLCRLLYSVFISKGKDANLYLNFLQQIENKEKEIKQNKTIIEIFKHFLFLLLTQESNYLLEKMIELKLTD